MSAASKDLAASDSGATTPLEAFQVLRATEPGRPLLTMYDDASGERVELSVATTGNWVDKVANLFSSEWGLSAGDGLLVDVPAHWVSLVSVLGAWAAGLVVHTGRDSAPVAASVVAPSADALTGGGADSGDIVLATALLPFGRPFAQRLPAGWLDFATEVPPQPDTLLMPAEVVSDAPAWLLDGQLVTHAGLMSRGRRAAAAIGLSAGGRLLTDVDSLLGRVGDVSGLEAALLAPLAVQGSVVLIRHRSAPGLDRRSELIAQEQVTCLWSAAEG